MILLIVDYHKMLIYAVRLSLNDDRSTDNIKLSLNDDADNIKLSLNDDNDNIKISLNDDAIKLH